MSSLESEICNLQISRLCLGSLQQPPGPWRSASQDAGPWKGSTRRSRKTTTSKTKSLNSNITIHIIHMLKKTCYKHFVSTQIRQIYLHCAVPICEASTGATPTALAIPWTSAFRATVAAEKTRASMICSRKHVSYSYMLVTCCTLLYIVLHGTFCSTVFLVSFCFSCNTNLIVLKSLNHDYDGLGWRWQVVISILRRCEPTNVRWDHLGLGKCSRRLRFMGVSWIEDDRSIQNHQTSADTVFKCIQYSIQTHVVRNR